jgi:CubicO group peptidase (beta-lactamase class C family)
MPPLLRHTALALALILATSGSATAAFNRDVAQCLDQQSQRAPFRGFVAARSGTERFEHATGFADAQDTRPITRDTPFRLASVGKVFTRVAVGLLIDEGKVRLDDPIRRHLPELPESFAAITVGQLVAHRSGVSPMTRPEMADGPAMAAATTARDLVQVVASKPLGFEPGSQEQYSNGGYLLLGALIEAVTGEPYRNVIARRIFDAVGMAHSSFEPDADAATPLTRLTAPGQPPAATPQPRIEFPALKASAAGDALSSASDLEALAARLIGDDLLTTPTKAALFPRGTSHWQLGQAGGSVGSNTGFWVYPEANAWLIVLSNIDPPSADLVSEALKPVVLGGACSLQAPKAMPPR